VRLGIHYKTTIAFGVIVAVILCAFYAYLWNTLERHTYQRIEADLNKEALLARAILEKEPLVPSSTATLDSIADDIGRIMHSRITIIDPQGNVLGNA